MPMKPILTSKPKVPVALTGAAALVCLMIILSIILGIKYRDDSKTDYAKLKLDEHLQVPQCSAAGGFSTDAFAVSLHADVNDTIYYTLDGTPPSLASPIYTKPLLITDHTPEENGLSAIPTSPRWKPPVGDVFKGTVLRAIVVHDHKKSAELIRTFFVDEKGKKQYTLPVIALTVDPDDFFGYRNGIYVPGRNYEDKDYYTRKNIALDLPWWEYPSNYLKRGDNSERPVHVEFYENSGQPGFEIDAGVRINGNATRGFSQKSLRICFNKKYGTPTLNYPLFPGYAVKEFNSIMLRNSGNDWDKTMFRDGFMQSLMADTKVDIQHDRPAIVFINGEYWGIHNIRERFDEHYIANKYKLASDSISILELSGELVRGSREDERAFAKLLAYAEKNDLSKEENYAYVASKIDTKSLTDFIIANVYFCNSDWPNNNVKFWRYQAGIDATASAAADGRWRWMLYDTDWGFGYNSMSLPSTDLLSNATTIGSVGTLFSALLKNPSFVKAFLNRFQYHLNTTFYAPAVVHKIDQFQAQLDPEMQEHINRWRVIGSYSQWLRNVEVMKDFAQKRPAFQAAQLNTFFGLKNNEQIIIQK
jgi:hypothetical protein